MMTRFRLLIPREIHEAMLVHAHVTLPAECCGLLAGTVIYGQGRVTEHYPLINVLNSPTEFESESRNHFAAHKAMRASGTEVLAVYHSHPNTHPLPSKHDLQRSFEGVVNLIIGLRDDEPDVRGWWLNSASAAEADWTVVES
jgi:proteasome lid subunit RPN8/RPN11